MPFKATTADSDSSGNDPGQREGSDRAPVATLLLTAEARGGRNAEEVAGYRPGGRDAWRSERSRRPLPVGAGRATARKPLQLLAAKERTPRGTLAGFSVNSSVTQFRNRFGSSPVGTVFVKVLCWTNFTLSCHTGADGQLECTTSRRLWPQPLVVTSARSSVHLADASVPRVAHVATWSLCHHRGENIRINPRSLAYRHGQFRTRKAQIGSPDLV
jgi:hypothetical protein